MLLASDTDERVEVVDDVLEIADQGPLAIGTTMTQMIIGVYDGAPPGQLRRHMPVSAPMLGIAMNEEGEPDREGLQPPSAGRRPDPLSRRRTPRRRRRSLSSSNHVRRRPRRIHPACGANRSIASSILSSSSRRSRARSWRDATSISSSIRAVGSPRDLRRRRRIRSVSARPSSSGSWTDASGGVRTIRTSREAAANHRRVRSDASNPYQPPSCRSMPRVLSIDVRRYSRRGGPSSRPHFVLTRASASNSPQRAMDHPDVDTITVETEPVQLADHRSSRETTVPSRLSHSYAESIYGGMRPASAERPVVSQRPTRLLAGVDRQTYTRWTPDSMPRRSWLSARPSSPRPCSWTGRVSPPCVGWVSGAPSRSTWTSGRQGSKRSPESPRRPGDVPWHRWRIAGGHMRSIVRPMVERLPAGPGGEPSGGVFTTPLALSSLADAQRASDQIVVAAAAVLVAIPVITSYVALQRHVVRGSPTGAVKE